MAPRSAILGTIAAALLALDGTTNYYRYYRPSAALTYIGLDSVVMTVPASLRAPEYRNGTWDADPLRVLRSKYFDPPAGQQPKPMALVSLGPHASFGHAVEVIRDLKARRVCHVAIREAGTATPVKIDFGKGREMSLDILSIVLCEHPYGDGSSFDGHLPADRLIYGGTYLGEPNVR